MSLSFPQPPLSTPPSTPCTCYLATLRIASQTSPSSNSSTTTPSTSSQLSPTPARNLSTTLTQGQTLVAQWELLNGCIHSETHLTNTSVLRVVVNAVTQVLGLYEGVVEGIQQGELGQARVDGAPMSIFVGDFEVEDDEERMIVVQEALRHAVVRLGAVLQDVEEEVRQMSSVDEGLRLGLGGVDGGGAEELGMKIKELIGRLFRLLGRVNRMTGMGVQV